MDTSFLFLAKMLMIRIFDGILDVKKNAPQCAKKVDSPGPEEFAIGLVFFILNLPDGQVLFLGEIQITEGLLSILPIKKGFGAS